MQLTNLTATTVPPRQHFVIIFNNNQHVSDIVLIILSVLKRAAAAAQRVRVQHADPGTIIDFPRNFKVEDYLFYLLYKF